MPDRSMVGKYPITCKIAEGGMGAIYKAMHPTLGREIILKRLTLKKSATINERFKREAQLMMDFRHENIVQVFDHFKEDDSYFIAMEFIDGISLGGLIEKRRYIPNLIAMLIFREVCKALKYAHTRGVIHRDIKPDNVLISNKGEVKLTDFGIAMSKENTAEHRLTSAGMTLGTPSYMSPEQIFDSKNVDKRADIYSMGVVLYEMVTGKIPFSGDFTPESIAQIKAGKYIKAKKINPQISAPIPRIIKKAMHHNVKKRFKDLDFVLAILDKELKKFNSKKIINETICEYVYSNKITVKPKKTFNRDLAIKFTAHFNIIMAFAFIMAVMLIVGSIWFFKKGLHKEYFLSKDYGAIQMEIKVDQSQKEPDLAIVNAEIQKMSGNKYEKVDQVRVGFSIEKDKANPKIYAMRSNRIYLPPGNYRATVEMGSDLYQKDFYLYPRKIQKKFKDTVNALIVGFNYFVPNHLPLQLIYRITDGERDITAEADIYINFYGMWMKWFDYVRSRNFSLDFVSGKQYSFMCKKDGFYPRFISVLVKPYQTVLNADIALVPIPGTLLVISNTPGLDVLLNNDTYYITGGYDKKLDEIKLSSTALQTYVLSPGDYFLTVRKTSAITKTQAIKITSNAYTRISIEFKKENGKEILVVKTL